MVPNSPTGELASSFLAARLSVFTFSVLSRSEVMATEETPLVSPPTEERALTWTVIAAILSGTIASFVAAAGKYYHKYSVAFN